MRLTFFGFELGFVFGLFGGLALANAGLGAVHGLAGVIGGAFGAPHGAICAALLPQVMAANLGALRSRDSTHPAVGRYAEIAQLLTGRSNAGVEWVVWLASDFKIPKLGAYGLKPLHIAELVEKSRNASSMKANPVVLTNEELTAVVSSAI